MIKLLYFGDIVGRSGRDALLKTLPLLRPLVDAIIINGENAAHGFGITPGICKDLYNAGCDVITTGNHIWDNKEIISHIAHDNRLLRPLNFPQSCPGKGATLFRTALGHELLVMNVMGRLFMDPLDDPFKAVDDVLKKYTLGATVQSIVVDFHAEASSEKMSMGHFCDGRVSVVVGSHSHIPTADAQVLPGGTAYQTDAGMCGDYDSVIGMAKAAPVYRFTKKMPSERLVPAMGPATLCGIYVEINPGTGLAQSIVPIRLGGRLHRACPEPLQGILEAL